MARFSRHLRRRLAIRIGDACWRARAEGKGGGGGLALHCRRVEESVAAVHATVRTRGRCLHFTRRDICCEPPVSPVIERLKALVMLFMVGKLLGPAGINAHRPPAAGVAPAH